MPTRLRTSISPLILLFLLTRISVAQDYRCIIPGTESFFTTSKHYLRGIRIDSVHTAGSTNILFPYRSLRGNSFYGMSTMSAGGAWVGDKIFVQPDGTYQFTNIWDDTVFIRSQAELGDSWDFYSDTSKIYYRAMMTGKVVRLVDGSPDTVKSIQVKAYHRDTGYMPNDPSNLLRVGISKQYGFYELFDFFMFPHRLVRSSLSSSPSGVVDDTVDSWFINCGSDQQFRRITLRNPTWQEINDFEPGDVFEYKGSCDGGGGSDCTQLTLDSCISKELMPTGTIRYTFSRRISKERFPKTPANPVIFMSETKVITADTTRLYVATPGIMPEQVGVNAKSYYDPYDTICTVSPAVWGSSGTAFYSPEPCGDYSRHKVGYGKTMYADCVDWGSNWFVYWDMIYSRKMGVSCGSRQEFPTAIENHFLQSGISILPNPAGGNLNITFAKDGAYMISLVNVMGQCVSTLSNQSENSVSIDVSRLTEGIYLVVVAAEDGNRYTQRISIVH
ncbi:MAG: T9SS type A sorting domain-containing protein [Chitinophagaceae bacterium]|nr:T9SS type A sorting domain-containing protein [Chitinophagaceae bacterium]